MSILADIMGSLASGGLTGILGGALSWAKDRSMAKLEIERLAVTQKHDLAMAQHEKELMSMEADKEIRISERSAEAEEHVAQLDALKEGLKAAKWDVADTEKEGPVLRFIEGLRRMVRPLASYYSIFILSVLTYWCIGLWNDMGLAMTPEQAYDLNMQMMSAIVYLSTTILLWWFSTRGLKLDLTKK